MSTAVPGRLEQTVVIALSWCSWKMFGAAMDVSKAALENTFDLLKELMGEALNKENELCDRAISA
eukprot:CAMPEP_0171946162 /NCGR_PEP_ID=MMETSP0993-20121228/51428_1 /TAXON_ID=483369 /ORGANISM="non described non described, Strain CCMP2098" /LENGTH=64 /DNA_ID=CAMNT_0012589423 /DNA_START=3 /DNA_END=194 /DNA_ORIENTATION=+